MLTCKFFRCRGPHLPVKKIPSSAAESLLISNGHSFHFIWSRTIPDGLWMLYRGAAKHLQNKGIQWTKREKEETKENEKNTYPASFSSCNFSKPSCKPLTHWIDCLKLIGFIAWNFDHNAVFVPKRWRSSFSVTEDPIFRHGNFVRV